MGESARIKDDYIEIDHDAWIEARTGGVVEKLTTLFSEFAETLAEATALPLEAAGLFITARAGREWREGEPAVVDTGIGGGGLVALSEDLLVYRYTDPEHGKVVLIATTNGHSRGPVTAYADTTFEAAEWFDYDSVDIYCPAGHGWIYRSGELIDQEGSFRRVEDVFPGGHILADDPDADANDHRQPDGPPQPVIVCPTCASPCDIDMTR